MQYILTQEEFDEIQTNKKELKDVKKRYGDLTEKQLQKLCTKIANEMPVDRSWTEGKEPWGCIITNTEADDEDYDDSGCCDDCPVQDICPYPYKEWSK